MKNQALVSSKDKSKKLKCRLLQFLFGALRVSVYNIICIPKILKYFCKLVLNLLTIKIQLFEFQ